MPKDSQIDPKHKRRQKAKGGPTMAESAGVNQSNNAHKQSVRRNDV